MKKYAAIIYRKLISPSMRVKLRVAVAWLREQLDRACLWRWRIARLRQRDSNHCDIFYVGRKTRQELARKLLRISVDVDAGQVGAGKSTRTVLVSEMLIPGALRVPCYVITIIPLGQPLEELTARYDKKLRQLLNKNRARYHIQQVLDNESIARADREMLQPYARARQGDAVVQLQPEEVQKIAQQHGRLDLLYREGEAVGCHLGFGVLRGGKRYWVAHRVGFTEAVFSDSKLLHETNSINNYLALESAIENGFDYYDNGTCLGSPDDGLLQWKRRRGGAVETTGNHCYFYVLLPKVGTAQFLWDAPLFAVEHHKLTLHLGLPQGPNDEEVTNRYREMAFGGLFKVYLHSVTLPSDHLVEMLRSLYVHQKSPPILEVIPST